MRFDLATIVTILLRPGDPNFAVLDSEIGQRMSYDSNFHYGKFQVENMDRFIHFILGGGEGGGKDLLTITSPEYSSLQTYITQKYPWLDGIIAPSCTGMDPTSKHLQLQDWLENLANQHNDGNLMLDF